MKKTQTTALTAAGYAASKVQSASRIGTTSLLEEKILLDAANLRRDPADPNVWRRAGKPRKVFSLGVLPFLRFSPYADRREIELSVDVDNNLYGRVFSGASASGNHEDYPLSPQPQKLAHLKGEPILAVTGAEGIIRLLLHHAPDCYLTYTEGLQLTFCGEIPELPEIELEARDSTEYYASTGIISLTGESTGLAGSQLCEADAARVKKALLAAYKSVREQARVHGNWMQPITARYRLMDAAGNTLALGEKTSLGCTGSIPTGKVLLSSSDGMQTLAAGSLSARSYKPVLTVPQQLPFPWSKIIDRIVIEVTEQMEPVDPYASLQHGIVRQSTSGISTVTAQLPGLEYADAVNQALYRRLAELQLQETMYRVYTFAEPFGGAISMGDTIFEPGAIIYLGEKNPASFEKASDQTDKQNKRYCYSAALEAGEFTIFCNPKDMESGEYRPGVADIVRSQDLGTILSSNRVMEGEIVKVASLPRSGSGWDFSRLKLLMFGSEGSLLVTISGKGEFHSVTPIDRREVCSGRAVCHGTGSSGAALLAIAGGDIIEISGQKVTTLWTSEELPRGRFGAESLASPEAIGWNECRKEIWLADKTRLWRLCKASGRNFPSANSYELIRAPLPGIEGVEYQPPLRFGRSRGALLLATTHEVRNLSDETSDGLLDISLRLRGRLTEKAAAHLRCRGATAPQLSCFPWLRLRIFGSGLLGNYTLLGDRGTEIPEELLKVVFTGDVNAELPLRLALPYRPWLEESYTFTGDEDLSIHDSLISDSKLV